MKLIRIRKADYNWLWVYLRNYEPTGITDKEDASELKIVERILSALDCAVEEK